MSRPRTCGPSSRPRRSASRWRGPRASRWACEAAAKQIDAWGKNAARWESEPETREGRKELAARAGEAERIRDLSLAKYHHFEIASAAFQIGIVLASSMVITGLALLGWAAGGLGLVGLGFLAIGLFAPHVHLL